MRRKSINERSGNQSKTKKNDRFSSEKRSFLIEIRQLAILPDLGWSSTFAVDELNFCVRNGNRWILVAIITGMAPLVGLEATEKFQKCLILVHFCPILPYFQRKIKPCAKRVPKHTTNDSDLKNIRRRKFFYGYFM